METPTGDRPALDEKVWQEWVQKTKLREQATARKLMTLARMGLAMILGLQEAHLRIDAPENSAGRR